MINWCFSTLGCTERSLDEALDLAKRYGISNIEIRGIRGELDNEKVADISEENASHTVDAFETSGITPLVLGTSVSFHDGKSFDKMLNEGKTALKIASRIGFRAIRVFGNSIVGNEAVCICRVAKGIRELCLFAEDMGVSVWLETHGDFNTVERVMPIVEKCSDREEFGIVWDICHTHKPYGENWREFYDSLAPYIHHVHLKDVCNGKHVLLGKGELPIAEIVNHLISDGYSGCFSLEWERHWRKELTEIEYALDSLFLLFNVFH